MMARVLPQVLLDRLFGDSNVRVETVWVSLHTAAPASSMRAEDTAAVPEVFTHASSGVLRLRYPSLEPSTEASWADASPTGVGDPFAGLMSTIDELLEDE